ncbi:hypothetical protein KSF_001130 [Reticulibacter mediterranei]|uniref:Uncharacterized protein n=1 Tax=Reticulibacter mediterranei TaxID=2778369 RepID=A0A8J3ICT6_9CHLR|nr:hypothetical protein KSF_001130 [Reticulibacter mediterranei]
MPLAFLVRIIVDKFVRMIIVVLPVIFTLPCSVVAATAITDFHTLFYANVTSVIKAMAAEFHLTC